MAIIDLSTLPPPKIIDDLDFETIFADRKAKFIALYPTDQQPELIKTLTLESEPIVKLLQESSYQELILRQRINEAALAVMIAYANGNDLDNLSAIFNVKRLVVQSADDSITPPIEQILESDLDLRKRTPDAFEGLSVAGPRGAYRFYAKSADGRVLDAEVLSPKPCYVTVVILSRDGDGTAPDDLINLVALSLNDEQRRPIADRVTVQSAEIINYQIRANIYLDPYPEAEPIKSAALAKLADFINHKHLIGAHINRSAIISALHVDGVQRVELIEPEQDIVITKEQASYCTGCVIEVVQDE
ncbi:baseplate J/gp47 family protein [Utexia brackfieldae]|uniref:baseplate J/gp47 family protein n=1 Tax=Utexia brackfieldae TaxID=3074108 RepID=UPI00370D09D4